jgi:hypothetical protein
MSAVSHLQIFCQYCCHINIINNNINKTTRYYLYHPITFQILMCFYVCSCYEVFNAAFMHSVNKMSFSITFLATVRHEMDIKHTYLLLNAIENYFILPFFIEIIHNVSTYFYSHWNEKPFSLLPPPQKLKCKHHLRLTLKQQKSNTNRHDLHCKGAPS